MYSKRNYLISFVILVVVGVSLYIYIGLGHFPVAIVNSEIITEREYQKSFAAILNYTETASKTYSNLDLSELTKDKKNVKKLVLEGEIENKIIHQELTLRLGGDLNSVIDSKLKTVNTGEKLAQAASTLYGINFQDYIELFLRPVAEKEILDGKLFAENTKLDDWLAKAKGQASVIILVPGFSWENGKVR